MKRPIKPKGSPRLGAVKCATLLSVAESAKSRMQFTATKRVMTNAIAVTYQDKLLCRLGDKVTVERWYCFRGPTVVHVQVETRRTHCVPFGWVMEMGAPKDLLNYMPFAPLSWEEVLAKENFAKQQTEHAKLGI